MIKNPKLFRFALLALFAATAVAAADVAFKAPAIDATSDLKSNLTAFMKTGAKVQVSLKAGRVVTGVVSSVGRDFFLMDKLDESTDRAALVRADDVSVITYQAR